jgi:NADPH:quinone reductase-like Zn-dependent oxidoreductase
MSEFDGCSTVEQVRINNVTIPCGFCECPEPHFDPGAPHNRDRVQVRTEAFSCNYRDRALIFKAAADDKTHQSYAIGSEFCGTVAAVGTAVTNVVPGDRVIGNSAYTGSQFVPPNVVQGIPTNHASQQIHVLPATQVVRVPASMSAETGAAFAVGAQTTYSMLRRLAVQPGERVLVTAARSNTSLFAIHALQSLGAEVYGLTTSRLNHPELLAAGVKEVIFSPSNPGGPPLSPRLRELAAETGGFDCVIDPFFDLHFASTLPLLAHSGRYVSCGIWAQSKEEIGQAMVGLDSEFVEAIYLGIAKSQRIILNCLGTADDLNRALADYDRGQLRINIDSVFSNGDTAPYLRRAFADPARFGKVVYAYR